jgi:hypothetical protein
VALALLFAVLLGVFFFILTYSLYWVIAQTLRKTESMFRAADEIINGEQVPAVWLEPYKKKIDTLREKDGREKEIDRLGERAKRDVIKRIRRLRAFLAQGNYYDSPDTKMTVLDTMDQREQEWQKWAWPELFERRTVEPTNPASGELKEISGQR